tara:strand:+ start:728 stop:1294 length:567 start_codon:yes stop_codon:yes gene_type:complete
MAIWLASGSQRRAVILSSLFADVHSKALDGVDETPPTGSVSSQVMSICKRKAAAVTSDDGFDVIVVADTMVSDPDDVNVAMGKAADELSAASMLKRLSGCRHRVWSATGIRIFGEWEFFVESAVVEVDELTIDDMEDLIKSGSWKGKAGSYDLAGEMGKHARLVDGDALAVLGFAPSAIGKIKSYFQE